MKRIGLTFMMLAISAGTVLAGDEMITVGSGNTVGIYYAASSAVAKLFNRQRPEYHQWVVTEASHGSVENINNVLQGDVGFGLCQETLLCRAMEGDGPWEGKPHKNLTKVLNLYTEAFTIVSAEDAEILTTSDLKGKRINVGAPGSSDESYARSSLMLFGISTNEVTILSEPSSRSSDLLEAGEVDVYFFSVGHPAFSVREASSGKRKVRLVPIEQSVIDSCLASNPLLSAQTIPVDYYPELVNTEPVDTVGVPAILFTRDDMSEETVYRMVKEVMTNLDLFQRQHPAFVRLTGEEMAGGASIIPLHPGAKRYFKEAGLLQ
ncbi:hypothetical protein SCARR_01844 [Pontiella sulfatireligans]|uniref:Uncharacterized protein n=2 Tax=Pontiella sulfatireligans TaxID=2750658 RepID=A0A6C2UHV9_9BACT|nr:hypothetical protein SCARR_01844 [Pontiella sulfatireligans]